MADNETLSQDIVVRLTADIQDVMDKLNALPSLIESSMSQTADQLQHHMDTIQGGMTDVAGKAKDAGEAVGNSFGQGLTLALGAVATEFLFKLRENIDAATAYANKLETLKLQTGDTTTKLQQFTYAMAGVGVNSDASGMALFQLQRRIATASEAANNSRSIFTRLGLDVKEMVHKDAIANFEAVATKIAGITDPAKRAEAAMLAFSFRGAALLPLLDQGAAGIQKLMAQASGLGAVLDPGAVTALAALHAKMTELNQTSTVLFASFIEPLVPGLIRLIDAAQKFAATLEQLSANDKIIIFFSSIVIALLSLEAALKLVGGMFISLPFREMIRAFADFLPIVRGVGIAIGVLAVMWETNFANIRGIFGPVISEAMAWFTRFKDAMQQVGTYAKAELAPAFHELALAIEPIFVAVGQLLAAFFSSGTAMDGFISAIHAVVDVLATVIDAVAKIITAIHDNFIPLLMVLSVTVLPGLITQLIALAVSGFAPLVGAIASIDFGGLIGVLISLTATVMTLSVRLYELGAAWLIGMGPVGWATGLLVALGLLLYKIAGNWETFKSGVVEAAASVVNAIGDILIAFAALVSAIPGLGDVAAKIDLMGLSAKAAADRMRDLADQVNRVATTPVQVSANADYAPGAKQQYWDPKTGKMVSGTMPKPPGEGAAATADLGGMPVSAGDAARTKIEAIKAVLEDYKYTVDEAKAKGQQLTAEMEKLGKIDTNAKAAAQQAIYVKELSNTRTEVGALTSLLAQQEIAANKLAICLKDAHDPKAIRAYHTELNTVRIAILTTQTDIAKAQGSIVKVTDEAKKSLEAYYKLVYDNASTEFQSYAMRTEAAKNYLAHLIAIHASLQLIQTAEKDVATAEKARLDFLNKVTDLQAKAASEDRRYDRGMLSAEGKQKPADAHAAKLAEDAANLSDALDTLTAKSNEEAANKVYYDNISNKDSVEGHSAFLTWQDSILTSKHALDDYNIALTQLHTDQIATTKMVEEDRKIFAGLADTLAGPFRGALQQIVAGANPLAAIFAATIEKTFAFQDIVKTVTLIFDRLAQVLGVLRPILDLLSGILVGVMNVFFGLYNVMASLLSVLGVHIGKLQLLNSTINDLNGAAAKAVPLLQVTHDLPTFGEYEAGKWAPLIQKQQQQNTLAGMTNIIMNNGFANTMSKLGEILGVLVAVRVLLGLAGMMSGGGGGGSHDVLGNIMGILKAGFAYVVALFQHGTAAASAAWQSTIQATAAREEAASTVKATKEQTAGQLWTTDVTTSGTTFTTAVTTAAQTFLAAVQQAAAILSGAGGGGGIAGLLGFASMGTVGVTAAPLGQDGMTKAVEDGMHNFYTNPNITVPGLPGISQLVEQTKKGGGGLGAGGGGIGGAMEGVGLGQLFGNLMGGGSHVIWGEIGGAIGGALFGPIGAAIGSAFGSLFGHKGVNATDNPDQAGNVQGYAQFVANMNADMAMHAGNVTAAAQGIYGQFSMAKQVGAQVTAAAQNLNQLPPQMQAMAKQLQSLGGASMNFGIASEKQGVFTLGSGAQIGVKAFQDLIANWQQGVAQMGGMLGPSMAQMMKNASSMNLAAIFGNGITTLGGGGGGGSQQMQEMHRVGSDGTTNHIQIGEVHGLDPAFVEATFRQVFDKLATHQSTKQLQTFRTNRYLNGVLR
jgi:hypothetical protein